LTDKDPISGSKIQEFLTRHFLVIFLALAVLFPLIYTLITQHVWEDFFITFRFSRNLVAGHGLVYELGEKVHGFTSPLGVLLPALCYWLTGAKSYLPAIWLFRLLFCIPAYAAAGYLLIRIFQEKKKELTLAPFFIGLLYLLEVKSIVFSVNGMETALMLFFVAWSFYLLQRNLGKVWPWLGLAWAGLMWTRPDSCVYVAVFVFSTLLVEKERKKAIIYLTKSALVTAVLYLPWFIWAWTYYGSPIPHTVLAKGTSLSNSSVLASISLLFRKLPYCISWVFGPVYPHFPCWPIAVTGFAGLAGVFCFIYWLLPWSRKDRLGRQASFMFFLLCFYLALMFFPYPWYFPAVALLGLVVIVSGINNLCRELAIDGKGGKYAQYLLTLILLPIVLLSGLVVFQLKLQQQLIETEVRTEVGKWLRQYAGKDEKIYLECLGYIGYFSEGRILDYPGLCTPEVVRLVKEKKLDFYSVVPELKPEWLVFRLGEALAASKNPYISRNYRVVKVFDATDRINQYGFIPGEAYLIYDNSFMIYRRADLPPVPQEPLIKLP